VHSTDRSRQGVKSPKYPLAESLDSTKASGATVGDHDKGHPNRDTKITLKMQTHIRQLSPRRPTAFFQSGRKERTQRSPACGPSAPPLDSRSDLRLARGLPLRPSTAPHVSASLEGSEPTLEQGESSPSRSRPPLDVKDKRPFCSPARRTGALNATHSSTAPRTDGVRPLFPTVAMTGVPSANSGHCSAIPDAVATLWEPATRYKTCLA